VAGEYKDIEIREDQRIIKYLISGDFLVCLGGNLHDDEVDL
jgi:hypothetical protein